MISNLVLVAPDAFKGSLPASRVARAIARGLQTDGRLQADLCPLADGGEGTTQVLVDALGGTLESVQVSDPLGRPLKARFGLLGDGETAVVEVAQASGLALLRDSERDAVAASSKGTGQLVLAAVAAGARRVLLAAGGSASTDGGTGAIEAIERGGGLRGAQLEVLCDVQAPFEQAATRYAPQKGADAAAVARLQARLTRLARRLPRDPRGRPMGGAAGGLAGGLWAHYDAPLRAGAVYVLDVLEFDARMRRAHAVIVGEGALDQTTLEGKVAFEAATRARQAGVPAYAVVAHNLLERFDARILDLQLILEARTERSLVNAGKKLAARI
ncbi:MAG TPA: glycerate kinase [Solirubrobacteraceae bacterium]